MAKKVVLKMISTLVVLIALSVPSSEQDAESVPMSPCPSMFQYETPTAEYVGPQRRWYGTFTIPTGIALRSLQINIILDRKADILGNWLGDVTSKDNIDFRIENTTVEINPGDAVTMRFFVQYSPLITAPRLKAIRMNGWVICKAREPSPGDHSTQQTPSSTIPSNPGQTRPNTFPELIRCGKVAQSPVPLIINGVSTSEGQWPWQIALFQAKGGITMYQCGGTLVSHQHVITAAHCVTKKKSGTKVNPHTLAIHLGKHNLKTSVVGVQIRYVSDIIVHPDFNKESAYSRDLAIVVLQEPVTYTNWVRPACLWPENQIDIKNVIGRRGSVVGWGIDNTGETSLDLNLAEMPVIDELTCIRSNKEFFIQFSSEYTYCAGHRNGTSVCLGDSGGGMVFDNAGTWYLRGLVSLSVVGQGKYRCDPSHYTIFTDLAQFLPWIKENVNDF